MTSITLQDGKVVLRDGKVGTGQACCCCSNPCGGPDGTSLPEDFEFPEFLYVVWGFTNGEDVLALATEFFGDPGEPFSGFVGTVCYSPTDLEEHLCFGDEAAGITPDDSIGNLLVAFEEPGLFVSCGKLTIKGRLDYRCFICGENNTRDLLFTRSKEVCLQWENDEDGYPAGDAQVISWSAVTDETGMPENCADSCFEETPPTISLLPP